MKITLSMKIELSEQLKFFGAKKQSFISVYAKKPRIRVRIGIPNRCLESGYTSGHSNVSIGYSAICFTGPLAGDNEFEI